MFEVTVGELSLEVDVEEAELAFTPGDVSPSGAAALSRAKAAKATRAALAR